MFRHSNITVDDRKRGTVHHIQSDTRLEPLSSDFQEIQHFFFFIKRMWAIYYQNLQLGSFTKYFSVSSRMKQNYKNNQRSCMG